MVTRYFGFAEDPFGVTPDPRFLFASRTHREALASLHYAYYSNRGFTALIAPPGMGKTTLLVEFLNRLRETARTAFLFNSQCEPLELLQELLLDLDIAPQQGLGPMLQQLNAALAETAQTGRHFVAVVDEAQNLSEPALEMLRLLTNFETARAKLMQIVLSGQPQLGEKILRPGLVQLRQRISTICRLEPFTSEETAAYISHRLKVAGYQGVPLFTTESLVRLAEVSEGIPRNVNTLCFNALSLCCALRKKKVDLSILNEVIRDLQWNEPAGQLVEVRSPAAEEQDSTGKPGGKKRMRMAAAVAALLLGVIATIWAMQPREFRPVQALRDAPSAAAKATPGTAATTSATTKGIGKLQVDTIVVTVDPEQTLSDIAVRKLGVFDPTVLQNIQKLNPDLLDPDLIHPGQTIVLPRQARAPENAGPEPELTGRKNP